MNTTGPVFAQQVGLLVACGAIATACGGRILGAPSSGDSNVIVSDASAPSIVDSSAVFDVAATADASTASTDSADGAVDTAPPLDTSHCLTGGNVFYGVYVAAGVPTTVQPPATEVEAFYHGPGDIEVSVYPPTQNISSVEVSAPWTPTDAGPFYEALHVGTYSHASDAAGPDLAPGQPGLAMEIDDVVCGVTDGTFVVTSLDIDSTGKLLHGFTIAFAAQCAAPLVQEYGCVHMENLDVIVGQ